MSINLSEAFEKYVEAFDKDYPMFMYNDSPDEATRKMLECVEKGKPVEELYPVNVPKDVLI